MSAQAEVFSSLELSSSLGDALDRIHHGNSPIDSIYLSSQFDRNVIGHFIKSGRKVARASNAAVLAVVQSSRASAEELALLSMDGVDHVLLEPFSAAALQHATKLARKVVSQRSEAGRKASIDLLVPALALAPLPVPVLALPARYAAVPRAAAVHAPASLLVPAAVPVALPVASPVPLLV